MTQSTVRTLETTIERPLAEAYAFAHVPENFPRWASGLSTSLHKESDGWRAETPVGEARVRFSEPNTLGVLDHWVDLPGQQQIYIPLRMVAQGDETVVSLTLLRQPSMSDADFERDAHHVERDLAALKALLEAR